MKKKKIVSFIVVTFLAAVVALGQKEETVFSYGNKKVSYEEFKRGFLKNQSSDKKEITEKDVKDYLNLYVNFKLKVQDAYDRQMDTARNFRGELSMYRKQIAKPFLTDKQVTEHLMKEAYERMKYEVNASHILIVVKNFDNVADTLRARKYLDSIRGLIESGAMDFATAAERFSEDPSAKFNKGELGYFSAFEMVYPFESMAYNTETDKISPVFKTDFGYHIVQVHDKRLSAGEIKVSHIMIKLNVNASDEEVSKAIARADGVYEKIKSGEKTFEEMVKLYSEDNSSSAVGGELSWFKRTSQYPEEFKKAAFSLENNGDISPPVKTDFGVHIIKRIDLKPLDSYDKMTNSLSQRINRDSRSQQNTQVIFEKISKELSLKENTKVYSKFVKDKIDESIVKGEWSYKKDKNAQKVLFSFADQKVTVEEFAQFLERSQSPVENADKNGLVKKHYKNFLVERVMSYYEENLDRYNTEFKYLLQEYKDGILLFSLMDDVIWTRSMKDSAGLQAFFEQNRENYRWEERFDVHLYITSGKDVEKHIVKMIEAGISNDSILNYYKNTDPLAINVKKGKYGKGEDDLADKLFENKEARNTKGNFSYLVQEGDIVYIVRANEFLLPGLKELDEVRGPVTSDYQNVLETEWISGLKEKYPVAVNEKAIERLLAELN